MADKTQVCVFRFGPYESRAKSLELYKHGTKLKVRPQPLRLLNLLLSNAGEVLTRDELRQELWSSETFVDFEHGLNSAIKSIRSALNDSVSEPRYIETIPKVGYRFIAPEERISEAAKSSGTLQSDVVIQEASSARQEGATSTAEALNSRKRPWAAAFAVAAVIVLAAVGIYWRWNATKVQSAQPSGRLVLAILPFQNLSGGADEDYFSDGLTEELIAQFGNLDPKHLGVIARTSVMHYKHSEEPLDLIGRELGVQYALEGSVRRDADKVRISAQLIQLKDQTRIWSREYDRQLNDLLALQSEIARDIGKEIQVSLGNRGPTKLPTEGTAVSESYQAYDLYLKGQYFWNQRTSDGFKRAVGYFQGSINKSPNYARAYAGLADSYVLMSGYSGFPPNDLLAKGRAAAEKAVELDDSLAEAHTAKALVAQDFDWDWKTAEREYLRAIELNPNYATARHWYAEYLALMGRFDEAQVQMEQARQLDPLSLIIATDNGVILYYARQYDRAIAQFRTVREMDPGYPRTGTIDYALLEKGSKAEVLADVESWRHKESDNSWHLGHEAYLLGRLGRADDSRAALEKLLQSNTRRPVDPLILAIAYLGADAKNDALRFLENAHASHSVSLTSVNVDPIFDPLRDEPRYQALLKAMNLTQ